MSALKLVAAFSSKESAASFAKETPGHLLSCPKDETAHLPFAALFLGVTDDLDTMKTNADIGVFLVCERAMKNLPLSALSDDELPESIGVFAMVANPKITPLESDRHWRDRHAPLALEVHTAMTHYYQLSVIHRFDGPEWNGFALCCFASEDDLRHRFFDSREGEKRIAEDVRLFADTKRSPRRVITCIRTTLPFPQDKPC
jgi:hypothetical protein